MALEKSTGKRICKWVGYRDFEAKIDFVKNQVVESSIIITEDYDIYNGLDKNGYFYLCKQQFDGHPMCVELLDSLNYMNKEWNRLSSYVRK